jgi:hypothetical protein
VEQHVEIVAELRLEKRRHKKERVDVDEIRKRDDGEQGNMERVHKAIDTSNKPSETMTVAMDDEQVTTTEIETSRST